MLQFSVEPFTIFLIVSFLFLTFAPVEPLSAASPETVQPSTSSLASCEVSKKTRDVGTQTEEEAAPEVTPETLFLLLART
jgi:hypothetical protein